MPAWPSTAPNTFTFAGNIFGTGSLLQLGVGTTILTAADSYSGGTTIAAGNAAAGHRWLGLRQRD